MNSEKVFLEWNWIDQQVMALGETIKESISEYTYITGIPRGGLIPGVYLSHYIGIKYISYDNAKELPLGRRKKILAVDDICDSGITLIEASEYGFHTAALIEWHTEQRRETVKPTAHSGARPHDTQRREPEPSYPPMHTGLTR